MSWGKVKKINSDMTMPLNELFWENKTLVAADTILQSKTSASNTDITMTFIPKFDGTLRAFANAYSPYTGKYFGIGGGGQTIHREELPYSEEWNRTVDFSVKKGVRYSVYCDYATFVKIGGMIIDVNPIEVVE